MAGGQLQASSITHQTAIAAGERAPAAYSGAGLQSRTIFNCVPAAAGRLHILHHRFQPITEPVKNFLTSDPRKFSSALRGNPPRDSCDYVPVCPDVLRGGPAAALAGLLRDSVPRVVAPAAQ